MSVALMWLLDGIVSLPDNGARVVDITLDSREVRDGSLFFALAGGRLHGLSFAAEAAARGASVILWEPLADLEAPQLPDTVFAAAVPQLRQLLGRIADRFFKWPSSHLLITGITGTNGKTTSAYLLAHCLERLGHASAYIGTLGWGRPDALAPPTHTTPDVITLHRELATLRAAGVSHVAIEVSSHALDQQRVAGVRFHTAAFTNLTRDHLDYHLTMAAYGAAKTKLFHIAELKQIVLNVGDEFGRSLAQSDLDGVPVIAVWLGEQASGWLADRSLYASQVTAARQGVSLQLDGSFGRESVSTQLMGRFNAENSLLVIACLLSFGESLDAAAQALAQCKPAPGRMEVLAVDAAAKPSVVVDYAHTPDALAQALGAAREHCEGALWCVFGCGGDRDAGKRPLMGAIADDLADHIIVTDDNPRSENPDLITAAILQGVARHEVRVIHDRGAAIGAAIREARAEDVVLIAGKGHEDYQIYGATRRRFSDRDEALRHLGVAA